MSGRHDGADLHQLGKTVRDARRKKRVTLVELAKSVRGVEIGSVAGGARHNQSNASVPKRTLSGTGDWALRYSLKSLIVQGFKGQGGWTEAWRSAEPKNRYDDDVIGGGGHGLATAYYLAREHGITNVAVLEKGWIGGGGTGRNTTNVRSDYMYPESAAVYDLGLRLYEGLALPSHDK